MKLSIVTASRGTHERYLRECASSVREACSGVDYVHVIIVPSDRVDFVKLWLPGCVVISEDQKGLYPALNQAFRFSCSTFQATALSYINDDDGLRPEGFREAISVFIQENCQAIVYGRVDYVDVNSNLLGCASVCYHPRDLLPLFADRTTGLTQQGVIIPSPIFLDSGGFNVKYKLAADSEWFVERLIAGHRFAFVNANVAYYRCGPGQLSDNVEVMAAEAGEIFAQARVAVGSFVRRKIARMHFRWDNLGAILFRFRRSGFGSARTMFNKKVISK